MNDKEANKFEYLFKCKRNKFWLEVSGFKKKERSIQVILTWTRLKNIILAALILKTPPKYLLHETIKNQVLNKISHTKNTKYNTKFTPAQIGVAINFRG